MFQNNTLALLLIVLCCGCGDSSCNNQCLALLLIVLCCGCPQSTLCGGEKLK